MRQSGLTLLLTQVNLALVNKARYPFNMDEELSVGGSWVARFYCTRAEGEQFSGAIEDFAHIDPLPVMVASEVDEAEPDVWRLDCYFEVPPENSQIDAIRFLLPLSGKTKDPEVEYLPPADWVTISQQGLDALQVGRFHIHTSVSGASDNPAYRNFCIDPAQAFGTGHHETTFGCLALLDQMKLRGKHFKNIADIGTGTGLLAFAAQHLWPRARIVASDIDPVAVQTARRYADENALILGSCRGQLELLTAAGTDHPRIRRRAPYDFLIANILAGPLMELAPSFAAVIAPGGTLILAGLLEHQRRKVCAAYSAHGFRLAEVRSNGDWPALRFVKRRRFGYRRPTRANGRTSQPVGDYGEW